MILSFKQQQEIKPISPNNAGKYPQLAAEVESLEVDNLLGSAFYQAISESPESFTSLLDSTSFQRSNGTTIKHKGLRYVIAYLNYSKYVSENYTDTFSGFRKKSNPDSEPISSGDIKRLQQENREIAFNAFNLIREYLDLNRSLYPLWDARSEKKVSKPKFYGVKKTIL